MCMAGLGALGEGGAVSREGILDSCLWHGGVTTFGTGQAG